MAFDILDTAVPLAQNQRFWVACFLLGYDNSSKGLCRYRSYIVNRGVRHTIVYGGFEAQYDNHYHSLPRTSGKYNYPVEAQPLRKQDIQDFDNPSGVLVLNHLSSSDGLCPCRVPNWLYLLQQTWQLFLVMVGAQWACPLEQLRFWLAFLVDKVALESLAYLYEKLKSWLSLQVAKQDYLSDCVMLSKVLCSYSNYNIHQGKVQAQWN